MRLFPPALRAIPLLAILIDVRAQAPQPWVEMDYGPYVSASVSVPWPKDNIAVKGRAIHVGDDGWVVFDTELLRVSACGIGPFVELIGTPYDGSHGPIPKVQANWVVATAPAPGYFEGNVAKDPREIPFGPLAKDLGRYRGLWLNGKDVLIGYSLGKGNVLEGYQLESAGGTKALARTLAFSGTSALSMQVGGRPETDGKLDGQMLTWRWTPPEPQLVTTGRATRAWRELPTAQPSKSDSGDTSQSRKVTYRLIEGTGSAAAKAGADAGKLPRLNDGEVAKNEDDVDRCTWFDSKSARVVAELHQPFDLRRVSTFTWHHSERAPQKYQLYGNSEQTMPAATGEPIGSSWQKIATVDTSSLGRGGRHVASIADPDGKSLGNWRWLLFDFQQVDDQGSFYTEIDLYGPDEASGKPAVKQPPMAAAVALVGDSASAKLSWTPAAQGSLHLGATDSTNVKLLYWLGPQSEFAKFAELVAKTKPAQAIGSQTRGGAARWPEKVTMTGTVGKDDAAYVLDTIPIPETNPYKSWMRCAAFDFFKDGRLAVSTWNGDVWVVSGIDAKLERVTWQRFATGLHDPLGLKIVNDVVHTLGRDQITKLHDLNGDGETDYYECFNNDVLATQSFHEFAFDLQTDREGNFYFSKGGPVRPGGRGFDRITPHHGTVMRVSADGKELSVVATGLRAPNGIGVGPNGQITTGDNQGTWMPVCRLNWVVPGGFYGCVDLAHRKEKPTTYSPPICFLPMNVDNSGGGQVWVTSDKFGPLRDQLLHLSYGQCDVLSVLRDEIDGIVQGGVVRLPLSFVSSCMRGRFSTLDGHLYVIGFKGWQTRAARDAGLQRVRYTGKPANMPSGLRVMKDGIRIDFTDPLDAETANDVQSYAIEQWNYVWSERYGSPEISVKNPPPADKLKTMDESHHAHDSVALSKATLSADGKSVFLAIPDLAPVMQMKIGIDVESKDGKPVKHDVYLTIHKLHPSQQ